jgi:ectoine hydroxylase-related dioxygenase (phytanoyl-CoA dioxygenase family)
MDADSIAGHLAAIERDGYTIIEDAVPDDIVLALRDEIARLEHDLGITPADNGFEGRATKRIYNLLAHGSRFADIPLHPVVLPVVDTVLGGECLISSLSSIAIGPGERAQPIHADDQVMPLPKPHPATVANSMWAITDFTEANGATRIIPGSHLADHDPVYGAEYDSIAAEMRAGSILVWHGSLWHGGGANHTDAVRVGVAMNYCAGWVRQQENQQLGLPLDLVATFPPRLQQLCGFGTFRGLIGHIEKQTAAHRLLGTAGAGMLWDHA